MTADDRPERQSVAAPNLILDRPPSLTDAVVAHLRDGIVRGTYPPGLALTEAQLSLDLGTSRGTVREALRELVSLGLVMRSAHRGAVVTFVTPEHAEEVYTLRAVLESLAARLAVQRGRVDDRALAGLEEHVETMARAGAVGDLPAMTAADMDFHTDLSALSGHGMLMEHLAAIRTHSQRLLFYIDFYRPRPGLVVERHRGLLEVLRTGDADLVASAIDDHVSGPGCDIVAHMRGLGAAAAEPLVRTPGPSSAAHQDTPARRAGRHPDKERQS